MGQKPRWGHSVGHGFSARPIGEGIARRKGTGQRLAPPSKIRYGQFANHSDAPSLIRLSISRQVGNFCASGGNKLWRKPSRLSIFAESVRKVSLTGGRTSGEPQFPPTCRPAHHFGLAGTSPSQEFDFREGETPVEPYFPNLPTSRFADNFTPLQLQPDLAPQR
ncbi:MAG: hypothetical protein SLRJCFUN_001884 [Candidatus Fervidibacter sp.]